jgi:hypothetical protein
VIVSHRHRVRVRMRPDAVLYDAVTKEYRVADPQGVNAAAMTAPGEGRKTATAALRSCKSCSAPTAFDPATGGLKCPYCSAQKAIPRGSVNRHPLDAMANLPPPEGEQPQQLKCTHCGAQSTVAGNVAATRCAFCTAPLAPATNLAIPPAEGVVPFEVTKDIAGDHFSGWLKGLWFRPSNLKRLGRLREIRGIYIPNWAFDAEASSRWTAEAGYYYYIEKTEIVNGEEKVVRVQQTRWEPASGYHEEQYLDMLESASAGLARKELAGIEPFSLEGKLTSFDGDFLAGFEAESHGIDVVKCWEQALERIQSAERAACDSQVPGDTHRFLNVSTSTANEWVRSLLLPVYVAAYEYGGKVYRVVVNGQTGKVTGEAPWSVWKIVSASLALIVAIVAVFMYFHGQQ